MYESHFTDNVARPTECPFCRGTAIDTLAKVYTLATLWRCCQCNQTWSLASRKASLRPR